MGWGGCCCFGVGLSWAHVQSIWYQIRGLKRSQQSEIWMVCSHENLRSLSDPVTLKLVVKSSKSLDMSITCQSNKSTNKLSSFVISVVPVRFEPKHLSEESYYIKIIKYPYIQQIISSCEAMWGLVQSLTIGQNQSGFLALVNDPGLVMVFVSQINKWK